MQLRCRCSMRCRAMLLGCGALILTGCAAIPLKRLQPVVAPPSTACSPGQRPQLLLGEQQYESPKDGSPPRFHYATPGGNFIVQNDTGPVNRSSVATYQRYRASVLTSTQSRLPRNLQNEKVTKKLSKFLTAVSGQAQLNAAVMEGTIRPDWRDLEQRAIDKDLEAPNITHGEMKDFADQLFDSQLRPGAAAVVGSTPVTAVLSPRQQRLVAARAISGTSFVAYFKAYYQGKFIDRMGQTYSAPAISTTITDTEITDAETVLLEFLIDAIDRTPVFGDAVDIDHVTDSTKFYPGGTTDAPTVYTVTHVANPSIYMYIPTPQAGSTYPCGITTGNAWVLNDLASGAGDEAAAVGGLIANTAGGVSVGLGILGKISIGDNQTLSVLVKTAASRVALRATLASSYYTLRYVRFDVTAP